MSKIEINNEVVLMRHVVRRARLHVIRKLIKQVKMLGTKKGDDKQREKYKRKADKLGKELTVIKKIQDDEISRFSITNERKLEDILTDPKSDAALCVMARLANHKIIKDRVNEFKKKFPDYEKHLGPGKRKLIKLKRKAGKQAKKDAKIIEPSTEAKEIDSQDSQEEIETSETEGEGMDDDLSKTKENVGDNSSKTEENADDSLSKMEENLDSESPEKSSNAKRKIDIATSKNKKRIKVEKKDANLFKPKGKLDKLAGISTTNKESTVKSFTRFLEDENGDENSAEKDDFIEENKIVLEKEVDSFFMTEDGAGEYLSVVVPKVNVEDDEESENTGTGDSGFARSRNNRFFDKIAKVERPRFNNQNNNNSFSRGDRYKERNQSRDPKVGKYNRTKDPINEDKTKSESQTMHPSWAAKKKEQEMLKLGFQGKKIVFDD